MNIIYEPVWGSQERWDITFLKASMTCNADEEQSALENGWLIYNNNWYLSRSVRISAMPIQSMPYTVSFQEQPTKAIEQLWESFLERKGFSNRYDLRSDLDRACWLTITDDKKQLAGFTKLLRYNGGIESQYNAYGIYPGSTGKTMLKLELDFAHQLGYKHLYIGSGYERSSMYKSEFTGFEYWNGSGWSGDIDAYKKTCERDSQVSSIEQLAKL